MADNFSEIIANLENTFNLTLKKKVNGDLIQIFPADLSQCRQIQKYFSDNSIEFFATQPRTERSKKILLKGMPKTFPILKVKTELERLHFDSHRVSQLRNFRTKEPYPCFLVDIQPIGNFKDIYDLSCFLNYVIKAVPYRSRAGSCWIS